MKKEVNTYSWFSYLKNTNEINAIGEDFMVFEDSIIPFGLKKPFKMNNASAIICTKGSAIGEINLIPYEIKAPCFITMLADQIVEYKHISDDFKGFFTVFSKKFAQSLDIDEKISLHASILQNPYIRLSSQEMKSMIYYYKIMHQAIQNKENPHRLEVAKNLTRALFYESGYYFHNLHELKKSKQEKLVNDFIHLVEIHFRKHHSIEFYAKELCLTPKYMSGLIKNHSGSYAGEWINNRVILEAKALMSSTNMTIQQISDTLHFPSQSAFGKHFKRLVGIPPTEYRKK